MHNLLKLLATLLLAWTIYSSLIVLLHPILGFMTDQIHVCVQVGPMGRISWQLWVVVVVVVNSGAIGKRIDMCDCVLLSYWLLGGMLFFRTFPRHLRDHQKKMKDYYRLLGLFCTWMTSQKKYGSELHETIAQDCLYKAIISGTRFMWTTQKTHQKHEKK